MTRWVLVLVLAFAVVLAGCGLTMTRGPGPSVPGQRPVCTASMSAPKRDAIGAAVGFFTVLVGIVFLKAGDNATIGAPVIILGGVVTVGSYVSGGVGYYRVKNCRKAIASFEHPQ